VRARLLPLVLLLSCTGAAADHERLGDVAFGQADFATALGEYRTAARDKEDARVLAKLGAAALKSADYREAADAYARLAAADHTRASEAARGLEQVLRAADRAGAETALQEAVLDLRRLAPERVGSRYTVALVRGGRLEPAEAAGIGPLALAAAGDAASVDQMLIQYADALRQTTACATAAEIYQTALRRSRDNGLRSKAIDGFGACAVQLGNEALTVEHPEVAATWFSRLVALDSASERGRRALVGLGDARVELGDLLGATIAYQDAMRPGASDSIMTLATERLGRLGARATPTDSR
jgi:tetratricopeptide (TPR) repeat protein